MQDASILDRISKSIDEFSRKFIQLEIKVNKIKFHEKDNLFTGNNTFTKIPTILENDIKKPLLTDRNSNKVGIINNDILVMDNLTYHYIINNLENDFNIDFSSFIFKNNSSYIFKFTINGLYFILSCINLNGNNYDLMNINLGNGTNLIKQTINIDIDNYGNVLICSNSFSYSLGIKQNISGSLLDEPNSNSLIKIKSDNPSSNLFSFTKYSESDMNDVSQGLCTCDSKIIDTTSNSLLIKCKVDSKIAGIQISDTYYIPMYKVESI